VTSASTPAGRPLAGGLATGFALGAFAALTIPDALGAEAIGAAGLVGLALWLASPTLGALLSFTRLAPDRSMPRLASALGLAGLTMPLAVLAVRALATPDRPALSFAALAACCPTGVLLGLALAAGLAGARRHPRLEARPAAMPAALAGAALAGVAFVRYVAGPRLPPLNIALDLTLGCAAMGIVCAAGAPVADRRLETWLSLLALAAILALPLSGLIDNASRHWSGPAAPAAAPAGERTGPPAP
jgi:hypothetical protein